MDFYDDKTRERYEEAKAYLCQAGDEVKAMFDFFESKETPMVIIRHNAALPNEAFEQNKNDLKDFNIIWNQKSLAYVEHDSPDGKVKTHSPAMGLFHEIVHIIGFIQGTALDAGKDGTPTTSPEERRVLEQENKVALELKEPTRNCHNCAKSMYIEAPNVASRPEVKTIDEKKSKKK